MSSRLDRRTLIRTALAGGLTVMTAAGVAGCGTDAEPGTADPSPRPTAPEAAAAGGVLVAYFSRPGENYYHGDRIDLETGNTEVVARYVADQLGADTYRIEAADPYPADYEDTVARNEREQDDDERPAIAGALPDLASYGTLLLGSPIWNVRPPMIMRTFLEGVDLGDTTVHPFVTHAVSGLGSTESDYADLVGDARLGDALAVQGEELRDDLDAVHASVDDWLATVRPT